MQDAFPHPRFNGVTLANPRGDALINHVQTLWEGSVRRGSSDLAAISVPFPGDGGGGISSATTS